MPSFSRLFTGSPSSRELLRKTTHDADDKAESLIARAAQGSGVESRWYGGNGKSAIALVMVRVKVGGGMGQPRYCVAKGLSKVVLTLWAGGNGAIAAVILTASSRALIRAVTLSLAWRQSGYKAGYSESHYESKAVDRHDGDDQCLSFR